MSNGISKNYLVVKKSLVPPNSDTDKHIHQVYEKWKKEITLF